MTCALAHELLVLGEAQDSPDVMTQCLCLGRQDHTRELFTLMTGLLLYEGEK